MTRQRPTLLPCPCCTEEVFETHEVLLSHIYDCHSGALLSREAAQLNGVTLCKKSYKERC